MLCEVVSIGGGRQDRYCTNITTVDDINMKHAPGQLYASEPFPYRGRRSSSTMLSLSLFLWVLLGSNFQGVTGNPCPPFRRSKSLEGLPDGDDSIFRKGILILRTPALPGLRTQLSSKTRSTLEEWENKRKRRWESDLYPMLLCPVTWLFWSFVVLSSFFFLHSPPRRSFFVCRLSDMLFASFSSRSPLRSHPVWGHGLLHVRVLFPLPPPCLAHPHRLTA